MANYDLSTEAGRRGLRSGFMSAAQAAQSFFMNGLDDFWSKPSGFVECKACGQYWCSHVEALVNAHGDAVDIWRPDEIREEITVQVPVMPSQAMWLGCFLTYEPNLGAYKVMIPDLSAGGPGIETAFLGFIYYGEGRMILRSMILDWFKGDIARMSLECPQTSHSVKSQARWQHDMKSDGIAFAQHWSIWAYNKCLGCRGMDDSSDDLVPDLGDQQRRSPFRG